jgi:hypothetical protein
MTLHREILGTSLVVLAAVLRCCLSEELGFVPSRVAAVTMAVAQLLALARSFALVRFTNSGNRDVSPKCKHQVPDRPVAPATSPRATAAKAERRLCAAASRANAWVCERLVAKGPKLLVFSIVLMGVLGLRLLCNIFGQPSLLLCCGIIWPMALLVGSAANTVLQAPPHKLLQSTCFCAKQGGCCCGAPEECPYSAEFWASVSRDITQDATARTW